ncbi:retrovirus-related pol polyprotein from transposon TNT 1-94, partial [Tanacetum coccineum]
LIISQDLVHIVVNSYAAIVDYVNMEKSYLDEYNECLELKAELSKKNEMLKERLRSNKPCQNQNAPEFQEFFEINNLKAQLKGKDITISNIKKHIANLKGKGNVDCSESINNSRVIAPGMYKLDLQPFSSTLRKNKEVPKDYLKVTKEHADILRGIIEQARALEPSDNTLDYALISSTSVSGSKSKSNTRKNKITQAASSNQQNKKVEDHPRRVIQIVLWYLDSGCSKNMIGQRSQLINFVSKFMGTVRFGNDQVARIMKNVIISRVYYVEGLGHNLFSVGSRDINLYTLSLDDMLKSSLICLLSKASKTKSWLRHRRLSHLNFGTINELAKQGLVRGLPKLKYEKEHLCSACSLG